MSQESLTELIQFISIFDENLSVLRSMNIPDLGDFILFTLASRCLPVNSRSEFESQAVNFFPTVNELVTFIKKRISILQLLQDPSAP